MILYWSFINCTIFILLVGSASICILIFMRELLNKKNYVIQLTGTSADNLQEIQSQCQQLLNKQESDQQNKSKFQLMELSKTTVNEQKYKQIQEIKKFIKTINFMNYQINNILMNYHYQFNLMKSDNRYPKIVLYKSGMLFIILFNLFCTFNIKVFYYKYYKKQQMEFSYQETLVIGLFSFIINVIVNKYLVHLSNSHSYYTLFNRLKYKQTQIEKNKKELNDNLVYDRKRFKQFKKPIRLLIDQQEQEQQEETKEQQRQDGVEILFMKIDSLNDIVLDDEDNEMIHKLEQQDQYLGIYYFMLIIISLMIYTIFIQFHNLFYEVPSNHFLIINLLISLVVDYIYRLIGCMFAFTILFIYKKYKRINFAQEISKIQIYEVFEEHVKLGITCLDQNYESEEDNDELEQTFSKYSFVTVDSISKSQKIYPDLNRNQQVSDNGIILLKQQKKKRNKKQKINSMQQSRRINYDHIFMNLMFKMNNQIIMVRFNNEL